MCKYIKVVQSGFQDRRGDDLLYVFANIMIRSIYYVCETLANLLFFVQTSGPLKDKCELSTNHFLTFSKSKVLVNSVY